MFFMGVQSITTAIPPPKLLGLAGSTIRELILLVRYAITRFREGSIITSVPVQPWCPTVPGAAWVPKYHARWSSPSRHQPRPRAAPRPRRAAPAPAAGSPASITRAYVGLPQMQRLPGTALARAPGNLWSRSCHAHRLPPMFSSVSITTTQSSVTLCMTSLMMFSGMATQPPV